MAALDFNQNATVNSMNFTTRGRRLFPQELPGVDDRRILADVGHARTGSGIPDDINGVVT
jgi:hypothetical protein